MRTFAAARWMREARVLSLAGNAEQPDTVDPCFGTTVRRLPIARFVERVKEIYESQGIEVPDRILEEGVKALEEDRFVYEPPRDTIQTRLARLYVSRDSWGRYALGAIGGVLAIAVRVEHAHLLLDASGAPVGILLENAIRLVTEKVPQPGERLSDITLCSAGVE